MTRGPLSASGLAHALDDQALAVLQEAGDRRALLVRRQATRVLAVEEGLQGLADVEKGGVELVLDAAHLAEEKGVGDPAADLVGIDDVDEPAVLQNGAADAEPGGLDDEPPAQGRLQPSPSRSPTVSASGSPTTFV